MPEFRLDDLAREAGVATTTVRLYRSRGLLPPPRLAGRTGWYDASHLARLRLIARLQRDGYSLAGIGDLLDQWERGRSLESVIGFEAELDSALGSPAGTVLAPEDLLAQFPDGAMTPELMARAVALGLVGIEADGSVRVADRRFLDAGSTLARMGVPLDRVLDEWEHLVVHTDEIAGRFVALFAEYIAPVDSIEDLDADAVADVTASLARLRETARQVVGAALDAGVARRGRARLGALLDS